MGVVLPEGVLNNISLQKVRDFVESKLITSIPRDVFVSCGATVKSSLLFFRKFTEKEDKEWNRSKSAAKNRKKIYLRLSSSRIIIKRKTST